MRTLLGGLMMCLSGGAYADAGLGLTGASVSLGYTQDEIGDWQIEAALAVVDVAITSVHGFQGGLSFSDTAYGGIGSIDAHLYMAPRVGLKYGVFSTLSDVDGRALRWGTLGAETMFALGPQSVAEARAGIGYSDDGLDFVFVGAGAGFEVVEGLVLETSLDLTDYDEPGLQAVSYEAGLEARYRFGEGPFGAYASVTSSGFAGADERDPEVRIGAGISVEFGTVGGVSPESRTFRTYDPVAPLIRRGEW